MTSLSQYLLKLCSIYPFCNLKVKIKIPLCGGCNSLGDLITGCDLVGCVDSGQGQLAETGVGSLGHFLMDDP